MPISRQVRITRRAISRRFATMTLVTLANGHPHFVWSDDGSLFGEDFAHRPTDGRHDVVLHLHRFQHHDHVTEPHLVALCDLDLDDHALHRGLDRPIAPGTLRRRRAGSRGTRGARTWANTVADDPNAVRLAIDLDRELAGGRFWGGRGQRSRPGR